MYCPKCEKQADAGASFCPTCGTELSTTKKTGNPKEPPPPPPNSQTYLQDAVAVIAGWGALVIVGLLIPGKTHVTYMFGRPETYGCRYTDFFRMCMADNQFFSILLASFVAAVAIAGWAYKGGYREWQKNRK